MGALPFTGSLTAGPAGTAGTATPAEAPPGTTAGVLPGTTAGGLLGGLVRALALLRVAGLEMAILAGHLLLYPTGVLPERAVPGPARPVSAGDSEGPGPAEPPPVLLLHGFADNRSIFAPLRRSLRRHGWSHVEGLNYSPLTCDVRQAAAALGGRVERLCERSGHPRVDIVGHSLGGLIARYYVQRLDGHARVRTLVTLGTPHSGTRAVPLAGTHPIVRQMRPNSELMADLAGPALGCTTEFVAFWSDCDQLMMPVETARIEHAHLSVRNIALHGMGHLTMPVNGAVTAHIREILRGGAGAAGAAEAA